MGEAPQSVSHDTQATPRVLLLSDDDTVTGTARRLARIGVELASESRVLLATLTSEPTLPPDLPFPIRRIGSALSLNMDSSTWERTYLLPSLLRLTATFSPDVVVLDGEFSAAAVSMVSANGTVPSVAVVSALDGVGTSAGEANLVLEVGELCSEASRTGRSRGPSAPSVVDPARVPPILDPAARNPVTNSSEAEVAVFDLAGLHPETIAAVEDCALEWFAAHRPEWRVVLLDSPVGRRAPSGVESRVGGPTPDLVARARWVMAVPGYRAVHTWLSEGVPVLWITEGRNPGELVRGAARRPWRQMRTSQHRSLGIRAGAAADHLAGLHCDLAEAADVDQLREKLNKALEHLATRSVPAGASETVIPDGASAAAARILSLVPSATASTRTL